MTARLARWRTRAGVQVAAIGLVVLGLGLLVAGCGSGGTATSTTSQAARETAFLNYAQCMRQHGVAVSDPTVGPNGIVRLPRPTEFQNGQTPTQAELTQMQQARTFTLRVLEFNPDLDAAKKLLNGLNATPPRCGP